MGSSGCFYNHPRTSRHSTTNSLYTIFSPTISSTPLLTTFPFIISIIQLFPKNAQTPSPAPHPHPPLHPHPHQPHHPLKILNLPQLLPNLNLNLPVKQTLHRRLPQMQVTMAVTSTVVWVSQTASTRIRL
jgi:hypothetical protein